MNWMRWTPVLAMAFAGLMSSGAAAAQPSKDAVAQADALFEEGLALMEKGKHREACPKLQESHRLDPGIGTLFNLSDCYEHIGRTATAWSGYRDVAAASDSTGESARAQVARDRAAALEPKLSRLRIVVSPEAAVPGLQVQRNGVVVGGLLWGTDVPVDPGKYVVSASALLREPWNTTVSVSKPGEVVVVRVPVLQELGDMQQPARAPAKAPVVARDEPSRRSLVPVIVGGGVALAGIGLGVGFTVAANAKASDAEALRADLAATSMADNTFCKTGGAGDPSCAKLMDAVAAKDAMSNAALWSFVGAGIVGAAAITYWLWPQEPGAAASGPVVSVSVGPSSGGIFMTGAF